MRFIRVIALLAFFGPLLALTADACCAVPESAHDDVSIHEICGTETHMEAAEACCDDNSCADCPICHVLAFSPARPPLETGNHDASSFKSDALLVFSDADTTVLTPPPTL